MVKRNSILIGLLLCSTKIFSIAPLGLTSPYDLNIRGERPHENGRVQPSFLVEKSYKVRGFDSNGNGVNSLQIYNTKQNVLGLYTGHSGASDVVTVLPGGADSEQGKYTVTGSYATTQCTLGATYSFGRGFLVRAYVPIFDASLSNVQWQYAGSQTAFSGALLASIFDSFESESKELFDLNVSGWRKAGVGDVACFLDWERDFPQYGGVLRNVRPTMRLGITLPSGVQRNIKEFGSVPFGADGSVTIPFGGGIKVDIGKYVQLGFNAQFWYIWGKTKIRRIKTSFYQTDLLLPVATMASKQHGIIQNFSLHGTVTRDHCWSLNWFYEYVRKGEDTITPVDSQYGYDVINDHNEDATTGAEKGQKSLDESTSHSFTVRLGYDHHYSDSEGGMIPQGYVYYKTSFYGSRSNISSTVGFQFSIDF